MSLKTGQTGGFFNLPTLLMAALIIIFRLPTALVPIPVKLNTGDLLLSTAADCAVTCVAATADKHSKTSFSFN